VAWSAVAFPDAVAAQWEAGLGLGVANTKQNAVALAGTLTWNASVPGLYAAAIRGFVDAELAVPDFKEGLDYTSDRYNIQDVNGVLQRPKDDELWQARGWDVHTAVYLTGGWWRLHGGWGLAYNGLDRTWGDAWVVVVYLTRRTEIDVEILHPTASTGRRWRFRLSMGLWRVP
jgi:hypothetical protein